MATGQSGGESDLEMPMRPLSSSCSSGMSHCFLFNYGEVLKVAFMWVVQLVMTELGKTRDSLAVHVSGVLTAILRDAEIFQEV